MQIDADKIKQNKVVKSLLSRDFATFSFFLLVAFVLWVMHSTSMRREIRSNVNLVYTNVPEQVMFETELPKHVTLTIRDKGMELWRYYRNDFDTLFVDMSDVLERGGRVKISTDVLLPRIKARMAASTQIVDIQPKILEAKYSELYSKEVPFVLNTMPQLPQYHVLKEKLIVRPANAVIYGDKAVLDTITSILINVPTNVIDASGSYQFPILSDRYDCKIEPFNPRTRVEIEMSSEKKISMPVTVDSLPENVSFVSFPSNVDITFSVGVSKFSSITADDFKMPLHYNQLKDNTTGRVEILLDSIPSDIYNLKVNPADVEFILRENN